MWFLQFLLRLERAKKLTSFFTIARTAFVRGNIATQDRRQFPSSRLGIVSLDIDLGKIQSRMNIVWISRDGSL